MEDLFDLDPMEIDPHKVFPRMIHTNVFDFSERRRSARISSVLDTDDKSDLNMKSEMCHEQVSAYLPKRAKRRKRKIVRGRK